VLPGPTSRWFERPERVAAHHKRAEYAKALLGNEFRYVFNHSGRRSWKTETAKRALVSRAMDESERRFLVGAPTNKQVKRIYWPDLKALIPRNWVEEKSEGELWIRLVNKTEIHLAGMDAPDRVEGQIWHLALLDETGNMAERVWPEVISPMLADTKGIGWLIGVPEGRNHYFDYTQAVKAGKWGDDAKVFHWPSWEIMDPEEIEKQKGILDELTFNQEFGGEFVHFAGRAYYAFDEKIHCAPLRERYNPKAPLVFCFDFNVDPGVAAVLQPMKLPNGLDGEAVIGEVYVPRNSNTEIVARELALKWREHQGRIHLYGDFTGGARGSAKLRGSDWDIIQQILRATFGADRIHIDVPQNPPVRRRVNAVNARLKSVNGDVRLMVDPAHAPHVVKDLEGVTILEGTSGEIDKKSSPQLSHISDALGYYIHRLYPPGLEKEAKIGNLY
jgi:hypothetical protein